MGGAIIYKVPVHEIFILVLREVAVFSDCEVCQLSLVDPVAPGHEFLGNYYLLVDGAFDLVFPDLVGIVQDLEIQIVAFLPNTEFFEPQKGTYFSKDLTCSLPNLENVLLLVKIFAIP